MDKNAAPISNPQLIFTHKEVVTALIKYQGIHEGIWGLFVEFGLSAVNIGATDEELTPAAIVALLKLGLQKMDNENNMSVDAAKVNPVDGSPILVR